MQPTRILGEKVICPVCGKEFKITEEHCYITSGNFACSWKCFLNDVKNKTKEKRIKNNSLIPTGKPVGLRNNPK